ncbi:hypothetical protein KSP39_PZI009840 [Platanthera zijinensis]|uniref:Uncharacterized protein n=1 Tax=Platanthera zijinensis TaxID=2320716 RepID=A0AAP0BHR2_9ASPA
MAALFPLHRFRLIFSPVISSSRRELQQSLASPFPSSKLRSSPVSLNRREALLSPRTRASSEGTSRELVDDPKFVPLNDDDPVFGPPALLLMGFDSSETSKMLLFVKELDGEFLKIILCTEVMLTQSVWDALHTQQPDLKAVKVYKASSLCHTQLFL